jgi:ubiquinone/menaquinone biosynthesis C-methylase UbiE
LQYIRQEAVHKLDKREFDRFANEYYSLHAQNISVSGESPDFFAEYKIRDIAAEMSHRHIEPERVLDFGSGVGNSICWVKRYLPRAELTCVDVSKRSLDVAARRFPEHANFVHFDGLNLPFKDGKFDLAYAMCVFHHIAHKEHVPLLREIGRVIEPSGTLVIFEHNPYNPLTVRAVNTCEFDANARLIAACRMRNACLDGGFARAEVRYRMFFPRAFARMRVLEKYMAGIPLGAQYAVYASKS